MITNGRTEFSSVNALFRMKLPARLAVGVFLLVTMGLLQPAFAALFSLSDSDPNSPEFRRRFMASYGVNEAIEPKLTSKDRPLYEKIAPLLESNPQQAIQVVLAELKADSNPAFNFLVGNLYYQVNDFASAETHLRQTLQKFPSFRRAYRTLALTYVQRNQYTESAEPWRKVIELGGGDAQSYGLLAYAYLNAEKFESALAAYRMALMFDPDSADFRRGQAHCLFATKQYRAAIALLDELLSEQPTETEFWLTQANAFLALEQYSDAIANLEIVADSGKADWSIFALLGDLYLQDNVHHLAVAVYKRAILETRPADWSAAVRPLRLLVERQLFTDARAYLALFKTRAGELGPGSASEVRMAEAHIEMEIGDAKKALPLLEAVLAADPLDGQGLLLMGKFQQRNKEYEQAEFHFERATSVPGKRVDAQIALGRLAVERGRLRDALKYLNGAQRGRPNANLARYISSIQRAIDSQR
jgi:tetratricopeptide (TPR) repeat protein